MTTAVRKNLLSKGRNTGADPGSRWLEGQTERWREGIDSSSFMKDVISVQCIDVGT